MIIACAAAAVEADHPERDPNLMEGLGSSHSRLRDFGRKRTARDLGRRTERSQAELACRGTPSRRVWEKARSSRRSRRWRSQASLTPRLKILLRG